MLLTFLTILAALTDTTCPPAPTGMACIPGGTFLRGSNDGPANSRPQASIDVSTFFMDLYEVTYAEYKACEKAHKCAPANPLYQDFNRPKQAMTGMTWYDAVQFCQAHGKHLPTEAEWEKAARGVDGRKYPWGAAPPDNTRARFGVGYNATVPVGSFPRGASPYGVLDMSGNVWQWVSSVYRDYPYRSDDGRESLDSPEVRSTRGGSHDWPVEGITTTNRGQNVSRAPRSGHHNIGFRCAR